MNTFYRKPRLWIVLIPCVLVVFYILSKFASLAKQPEPVLTASMPTIERGSIVDRNGRPLAVVTNFYHFVVTPKLIEDIDGFSALAAPLLNMTQEEIAEKIYKNPKGSFLYIKKKITQAQRDELYKMIEDHGFTNFCRFDRLPGRVYPMNDLASTLIGFMGDSGKGLGGIEFSEQHLLSPENGIVESGDVIHGKNVFLTIDANLQYKLEKIAKDTMNSTQAASLILLAAESKTGEILSYINLPSVNLNEYTLATTEEKRDRAAINAYEPGSVFKIFTAAAYIDSGRVGPNTLIHTTGTYLRTTNLGETIKIECHDPHPHGWGTIREALEYSCNDAFAQMSETMGNDEFVSYLKKFGFGERTGVELPSETKGILKSPSDKSWSARTKATISIGQEISVSALQMLQASVAIANHGIPPKLTFIKRITDKDGNDEYVHAPEYKTRVLKSASADFIISCMEKVTQSGTGHRAALKDVSIGTKTGTAQIFENGKLLENQYISSCMGIFPVEDPQIVVYIVIEKAQGENLGGRIAAPVIRSAANEIIDYLGKPRDSAASLEHSGLVSIKENQPIQIGKVVPDFTGRPKRDLVPIVDGRKDLNFQINGEGWVVSQSPAPGTAVTENMTIELNLEY